MAYSNIFQKKWPETATLEPLKVPVEPRSAAVEHVAAPVEPVLTPVDKGPSPPGGLPFLLAALPRYHILIMPANNKKWTEKERYILQYICLRQILLTPLERPNP